MASFEHLGGRVRLGLTTTLEVELMELLGTGTFGRVWKCWDPDTGMVYALKVMDNIRPNSYLANKVRQEANVRIESPYIVPVVGCCEWDPVTFLILFECVEGITLHAALRTGTATAAQKESWFQQLLLGVDQAHQRNIIHRDLKPGNILIDSQDRVRIIDFGMAKFKGDPTITSTGVAIGTPPYMAPEVIIHGGSVADARADIYALGQILYEMAMGKTFWAQQGWRSINDFIAFLAHIPQPDHCLDVRHFHCDWLSVSDHVIKKMTKTQPEQRYSRVEFILQDLGWSPLSAPVTTLPHTHPLLIVESGSNRDAMTLLPLADGEAIALGRLDIAGGDASISKRHLEISYRDGQYRIADVGSRNGTFLRGERLVPHGAAVRIYDGEHLKVGDVFLRFVLSPSEFRLA